MVSLGLCSASLRDDRTLMKMGLGMVLVGHINFLLGALVHGAVLRHVSLHKQARAMEYAISNVIALVAGMMAVVVGVSAIVLSKNRRNKTLMWFLLVVSALCGLLAAASTAGLTVSMARATANAGRSLLTHCKFPDAIGYSSITNECPFDPTRIYGTTIVLWVPLAVLSVLEVVFSGRCFAACLSFLNLPCGTRRKRRRIDFRQVRVWRPEEMTSPPQAEPQRQGRGLSARIPRFSSRKRSRLSSRSWSPRLPGSESAAPSSSIETASGSETGDLRRTGALLTKDLSTLTLVRGYVTIDVKKMQP